MKKIVKVIVLIFSLNAFASEPLNDSFLDISSGYLHSSYSKKNLVGDISIDNLDKNSHFYDLALGHRLNKDVFATINYQHSKLDEFKLNDYYVTLNYQFDNKLKPYIGVLFGKSYLKWREDPLNSAAIKDNISSSVIYGVQTGLEYPINDKVSFIPKVKYTKLSHKTNLISLPAKAVIENNYEVSIGLGIRIKF